MRGKVFLLPVLLAASVQSRGDSVYIGREAHCGEVVADNVEAVVIERDGSRVEFRRKDVTRVEYDATPTQFIRAEALMKNGQFEQAVLAYQEALEAKHPDLLEQYILHGLGASLARAGNAEEAVPVFKRLLQERADTRFLVDATKTLADLLLALDRSEEIPPYLESLRTHAPFLALLIEAKVDEAGGRLAGAARRYREVTDGLSDEEAACWEARLGLARVALKRKDIAAFQEQFERASRNAELAPPEAMAEFCIRAGRLEKEKTHSDVLALNRALDYYTRVFTLYDTPQTLDFSAEAAFEAALLAELVSTRGELPQLRREAKRLLKLLIRRYPESRWARAARSRIEG